MWTYFVWIEILSLKKTSKKVSKNTEMYENSKNTETDYLYTLYICQYFSFFSFAKHLIKNPFDKLSFIANWVDGKSLYYLNCWYRIWEALTYVSAMTLFLSL
jgi:hypothetical protein